MTDPNISDNFTLYSERAKRMSMEESASAYYYNPNRRWRVHLAEVVEEKTKAEAEEEAFRLTDEQ